MGTIKFIVANHLVSRRWTMSALVLAGMVLGSCSQGEGDLDIELVPPGAEGVSAELSATYFKNADFEDVTRTHPEESFAAAVVEGASFEKPGNVYVLTLKIQNGGDGELSFPDLVLSYEASLGEQEIVFAAPSGLLKAKEADSLLYYWDPGAPVEWIKARLAWAP